MQEAQRLDEGDIIAKLDDADFQNRYESAKSQFANADEEFQRASRLSEQNAIAQSVFEQRKAARDVARSELALAEKALADTVLRAPLSGIVTRVPVATLQYVGPGEPIATVIALEGLKAKINIPANAMASIQDRQNRSAFVRLDAAPSRKLPATFKEATLEADPATQTFEFVFTFEGPEDLLILPGMNATMELSSSAMPSEDQAAGLAVPLNAIVAEGSALYVWIIDPASMQVSKRVVTIEETVGDEVFVKEGLKPGETIATAGASYLSEGMVVRPWKAD